MVEEKVPGVKFWPSGPTVARYCPTISICPSAGIAGLFNTAVAVNAIGAPSIKALV